MEDKNFIPDKLYKDIMDNVPICTVDIMFINTKRDKIILFRRMNEPLKGVYFTIGGRLLKEEEYIDCAIRQAKRELGMSVNADDLIYAGLTRDIHENSAFKSVSYDAVAILFVCEIEENNFHTAFDNQHDDKKWFPINSKSFHPFIQKRVNMTLSALKNK